MKTNFAENYSQIKHAAYENQFCQKNLNTLASKLIEAI